MIVDCDLDFDTQPRAGNSGARTFRVWLLASSVEASPCTRGRQGSGRWLPRVGAQHGVYDGSTLPRTGGFGKLLEHWTGMCLAGCRRGELSVCAISLRMIFSGQ